MLRLRISTAEIESSQHLKNQDEARAKFRWLSRTLLAACYLTFKIVRPAGSLGQESILSVYLIVHRISSGFSIAMKGSRRGRWVGSQIETQVYRLPHRFTMRQGLRWSLSGVETQNTTPSIASRSTFATSLPKTSVEISSAWRLDKSVADDPWMYELEEAMAEIDQEIEAAPRASAFGDPLLTASQRAAERPHDTSADIGTMHGGQDNSSQMRNTIGWIDEESSHQTQTAGQALLVDPKPFRCLWCNDKARHKSLEGFFAVFKLFEEGSRDTWRVTDIRNGRPAREALKPRACDAHKATLARLLLVLWDPVGVTHLGGHGDRERKDIRDPGPASLPTTEDLKWYDSTINPSQGSSVAADSTPTQGLSEIMAFDINIWHDDGIEGDCQQTEEVYDIPAIPLYEEMKLLPGQYAPDECLFCEKKGGTVDVGLSIWTLLLCTKTSQWFKPYLTDRTDEIEGAQEFRVCDKHREWISHPQILDSLREGPLYLGNGRGWFSILFQHVPGDSVVKMPQPSIEEADSIAKLSQCLTEEADSSEWTAPPTSVSLSKDGSESVSLVQSIATVADRGRYGNYHILRPLSGITYETGPKDQLRCSICSQPADLRKNILALLIPLESYVTILETCCIIP
ncbi:hypothetical protein FFLO_01031 [Filobasidium floriforme]|uniref:Uncharacterized protein n=1 Tax=Filobasidium floriforme TaxID=5210 RepID=A0A8K0JS79_9TREE|nr:hypothetical protein FFLO_01031 [Filobasidium floriforme]